MLGLRDEYSQTFAEPDGSYSLAWSAVPQHVEQPDGSWDPVDTSLEVADSGRVEPAAAIAGVSFSGGGNGSDAIRLSRDGKELTLDWPTGLPAPVLSGDTATYADVVPDVDLRLTATPEGFGELLVVRSAAGAGNPLLESLRLALHTSNLSLHEATDGGLLAVDDQGVPVFSAPTAVMWDSSSELSGDSRGKATGRSGRRTSGVADDPGEGDQVAPVDLQVADGALVVTPDQSLLADPGTVFPVYIDPSMDLTLSARTLLASFGEHDWQFTGAEGVGRCGQYADDFCPADGDPARDQAFTKRQFYRFTGLPRLNGKLIRTAIFRIRETWSESCSPSGVDLVRSNGISSTSRWPGPLGRGVLASRVVSAGRGELCGQGNAAQPDASIEFQSTDLLQAVKGYAANNFGQSLTLMLRASDESDTNSWKRFVGSSATLVIGYIPAAGVPSAVGVSYGSHAADCSAKPAFPMITDDVRPTLVATAQTKVKPAGKEELGSLRVEYTLQRQGGGGWTTAWSPIRPENGTAVDDQPTSARVLMGQELATNVLYRMHTRGSSHFTDSGGGWVPGPFSGWCYFKVDPTGPKPPSIASTDYPAGDADHHNDAKGPGQSGQFVLDANAADHDVVGFRYWLLSDPDDQEPRTIGSSQNPLDHAVLTLTPQTSGREVLHVQAKDALGYGQSTDYQFWVARDNPEVGLWHMASQSDAGADSNTFAAPHALTLTGAGWTDAGRRQNPLGGDSDGSLQFAGLGQYAATSAPTLDTSLSFTVSAEGFLVDRSHNATVVAQANPANGTGYDLSYSSTTDQWVFRWHWYADGSMHAIRAVADSTAPALNVWTHVAAVYDADTGAAQPTPSLQLFVNGHPQTKVAIPSGSAGMPSNVTGPMMVGRNQWTNDAQTGNPVFTDYWTGSIDEVHVWQRTSTADEVAIQAAEQLGGEGTNAAALVGFWSAGMASDDGSQLPDQSRYARDAMTLTGGAVLNRDDGGMVTLNGSSAFLAGAGPVIDETGSFTVDIGVQLDAAKVAQRTAGDNLRIVGQRSTPTSDTSSWALYYHVDAPVGAEAYGHWVFARWRNDGTGAATAETDSAPVSGALFELDGVYDADTGRVTLYLNGDQTGSIPLFHTPGQGSGALDIGRRPAGSGPQDWLPGGIQQARIWSGAMTADQIILIQNQGTI